ncbi:MAG TPA: hypothetical protein VLC52_08750 [Anaerolineae bacterium]|nr:hypothetical protein [Anaerolineae bacterium]
MNRQLPWLVFGLVVVLVVTVGSMGLALVLPGIVADSGHGVPGGRDQAGRPFSWDGETAAGPRGALGPLWLLLVVAVPLSLLGLAATGVIWASRAGRPAVAGWRSPCSNCGQGMETGWRHCPSCGERRETIDDW